MMPVRLKLAVPLSRVKSSTKEPLHSFIGFCKSKVNKANHGLQNRPLIENCHFEPHMGHYGPFLQSKP